MGGETWMRRTCHVVELDCKLFSPRSRRRNSRLAYYVRSMGTDAEKGLRRPSLTPFLRCQMLWCATSHAG